MSLAVPAPRRATVIFVFFVVALDVLSLGVILPVLPRLIEGFLGGDRARAAEWVGVFAVLWATMQFLFAPLLGALSDRFGRRPVILLSCAGLAVDYVLMALAPSLAWLLVGRALSGVTAASYSTANAYIADVMPPERRAAAYGWIGAAFGFGFILGPALGGLLGSVDLRLPFWAAAALCLANFAYGVFVLPESLPAERRSSFRLARANPLGALRFLLRQSGLFGLAFVHFLSNLAHQSLPVVYVLYVAYRYGWDEVRTGLVLALVGVASVAVQGGLVRPAVRALGERRALLLGLVCGALAFAVYGLAAQAWAFLIGIPVMAIWGLAAPSLQALMTRRVSSDEQGRLQGALSSLTGVTGMVGPYLFAAVFARSIDPAAAFVLPGAAFVLAALLLFGAAALALRVAR